MNTEEKILAILERQEKTLEQHTEMFARVSSRLDTMQDDIHRINLRLDLDVGQRLDALSRGQETIEKRLNGIEASVSEVRELAEKTADSATVIKAVVTQHSAAITELKKVQ